MVLIKPGKVNYLDSDEEDVKDEAVTKTNDDHKTPLHTKNTPVLRSSERIQLRHSRTFRKPKREDELNKIPTLGTPSKSIRSLKPRRLVNNLMRETHRYNYDPSYTSGESSTEDFINDEDDEDEDDSSKSEDSSTSGQRKSLKRKLSSSEDEDINDRKTKIADDLRIHEIDDEDDIQNVSIKSRAVISSSDSESSDVDQIGVKSANSHKGLTTVTSSDDDGGDHDCIKQSETVKRKLDFCTEKQETDNTNGDHDDGYDDDDDDDDEQCQSGDRDDDDESDDSSDVCLASQSNFKSPRAALMQRRRDRQRKKFAKLLEIRKRQNHDRNLLTISE